MPVTAGFFVRAVAWHAVAWFAAVAALAPAAAPAFAAADPPQPAATASPAADPSAPVALVADEITYDSETGIVTARGSVEVYYGARTMTADEIVYDSVNDRFSASGQIAIRNEDGTTLFADFAEIDRTLRDGLVKGAKAVIAGGARLSAVEAQRIDGRVNAMSRARFSPCKVCGVDPTPLWSIRARRVVHDEATRDIYYEDAVFEVMGYPVAWLPYFSHPDPTVKRRSGLLAPEFLNSGNFGPAIKVPYHFVIGPDRDATATLFATVEDGPILEGEYRALTAGGVYQLNGSVTVNEFEGDERLRGHLFADGLFAAPMGFEYGFDVNLASDDAYLRRYEFSEADRLSSELFVRRFREDGIMSLSGVYFQSLRPDEPAGATPLVLPQIEVRQRFDAPGIGGDLFLNGDILALTREDGRDVRRFSGGFDWERTLISSTGLALRGFAEGRADLYQVSDNLISDVTGRALGLVGVEARYPIARYGDGATHVIEPIVQLIWSHEGGNPDGIPNEDSQETEFDETNLFSTSRFAGLDVWESGPRANVGLRYEMISESGFDVSAAVGKVFRFSAAEEFSAASGLRDPSSDLVGAVSVSYGDMFTVSNRFRLGDDFEFGRNELFGEADFGRYALSGSFIFLEADAVEFLQEDRAELEFAGSVDVTPEWTFLADMRRDLRTDEFVSAGGGLRYQNECVEIDFSINRRFTDAEGAPPATTFGLSVNLLALTLSADDRKTRKACGG